MKATIRLTILGLALFISFFVQSQTLPDYWSTLKKGQFTVGFRSFCLFDTSRNYDLACGDSTVKAKKIGRPILINMWYPAKRTRDTTVLKIKDYFDFPSNDNTALLFTKLKAFQLEYSKLYAVDNYIKEKDFAGNESLRDKAKINAFENYVSSRTIAHRNAKAEDGNFPVIIYHQGIGGTVDENSVLIEYLASNGYIVINSAFQQTNGSDSDGWYTGTGDQRATFDDINFIINYAKQKYLPRNKKIFLMGHSYGANSSISFLAQGHQNVNGIVPLDSDFGYELTNFYPAEYNPFVKDRLKLYNNIPVFCIGRAEARFKLVDSLSLSKRWYLNIPGMRHNDFTSQGAIGRYFCLPYVKEQRPYKQATENFLNMCTAVLRFLNSCTKPNTSFSKKDVTLSSGWEFNMSNPGEKLPYNRPYDGSTQDCPTLSQFFDLIYYSGITKAEKVYNRCTDTSFKKDETLLTIFEPLNSDAATDTIVEYLNWMKRLNAAENNLRSIFLTVSNSSLFNSGKGFHFDKADSLYNWMIESFPDSKYGYIGKLLVSHYTNKKDKEFYCRKILEIEPDFENSKPQAFVEKIARNIVHDYFKKD